ncbi:ABC transporter B family member 11-like [Chenopodium quinoa]|uniref:ABC transporter B family member 11-like n=1 Tax=Chenopodium quinoa TaxID=63459 RepID=UPI000B793B75|nr:ABC transporter B family member 11-like [Chenopodium quinoa]
MDCVMIVGDLCEIFRDWRNGVKRRILNGRVEGEDEDSFREFSTVSFESPKGLSSSPKSTTFLSDHRGKGGGGGGKAPCVKPRHSRKVVKVKKESRPKSESVREWTRRMGLKRRQPPILVLGEQNQHNENQKNNARVPFYKLFSFADSIDKALMIIGSIGVVANGVCMPLMAIIIGEFVDSFGENQNTKKIIHVISEVSLKFVYLAIGVAIAAFLQVACWMVTGERQTTRLRKLYVKAILRQDIAFFDKETNTGEVIGRIRECQGIQFSYKML